LKLATVAHAVAMLSVPVMGAADVPAIYLFESAAVVLISAAV